MLEGFAFEGVAYSETVRAIAAGTITQILTDTPPLQASDLDVITSTGRIPAEAFDAIWGTQVWVDHGDGIESRYGGFGALLPGLELDQEVRRLTILGFAGEGPVYLGIWVDGKYLGYGLSQPETMAGLNALFAEE